MKMTKLSAVAVAAMMVVGSAVANNIPIGTSGNLYDLAMYNGSIGIGDKVFSGFGYTPDGLTSFNPMNIMVTASIENGVYYLTWGGNISLLNFGTEPATADLLLNYTVTANPGQIVMIDQYYTGGADGQARLLVNETVSDGKTIVANSQLALYDLGDPFAEAGDDLIVNPPASTLYVTKDIVLGVAPGGLVSISEVRQSFHQTVSDGGATLSMLGLALAGVAMARRLFRV